MNAMTTKLSVYILAVCLMLSACSKIKLEPAPDPLPTVELGPDVSLQKNLPFPVGAAVNVNLLKSNTKYRDLVIKEFNSVTAENAMKFAALHPSENTWNWTDADYLVDFAVQNGKRVHG